jgi:hypothetical protein
MAPMEQHPTVKQYRTQKTSEAPVPVSRTLDREWLRELCLEAGADDVGFVPIDRSEIADQRGDILWAMPATRSLISIVVRMNRENIRTPARSIANLEFHHAGDETNEIVRRIVAVLERSGVRAINGGAIGFPMEADRWGTKMWVVSHKPVAVAAGLRGTWESTGMSFIQTSATSLPWARF